MPDTACAYLWSNPSVDLQNDSAHQGGHRNLANTHRGKKKRKGNPAEREAVNQGDCLLLEKGELHKVRMMPKAEMSMNVKWTTKNNMKNIE